MKTLRIIVLASLLFLTVNLFLGPFGCVEDPPEKIPSSTTTDLSSNTSTNPSGTTTSSTVSRIKIEFTQGEVTCGETHDFGADVTGLEEGETLIWSIRTEDAELGDTSIGTIDENTGVYTAPIQSIKDFTITIKAKLKDDLKIATEITITILRRIFMVKDIATQDLNSDPDNLIEYKGNLIFTANDHGICENELYKWDGETVDLIQDFTNVDGETYTVCTYKVCCQGICDKYPFVGTVTVIDKGDLIEPPDSPQAGWAYFNTFEQKEYIYLYGVEGCTAEFNPGWELYGTTFGGSGDDGAVKECGKMVSGGRNENYTYDKNVGSTFSSFIQHKGKLMFLSSAGDTGRDIWSYDGNIINVFVNDYKDGASLSQIIDYNDLLFFSGQYYGNSEQDGQAEASLWNYDGDTVNSTCPSLNPEVYGGGGNPNNLFVFNGLLYFTADVHLGRELYQYNGDKCQMLLDIDPNIDTWNNGNDSNPQDFIEINDILYFVATHVDYGDEIWQYNGLKDPEIVQDFVAGYITSNPRDLVNYQDQLYCTYTTTEFGRAIYRLEDETFVKVDACVVNPTGASTNSDLFAYDDKLFFSATNGDGTTGFELYMFNGTETVLVEDINSNGDSKPHNFARFGDKICFAADDYIHGIELWALRVPK